MRRTPAHFAVLALLAASAVAQTQTNLQPLPAVPPPPPDMAPFDAALEPQVTITKREGDTVEEHRINGKLYRVKVTPADGIPYWLIDRQGDGHFAQEGIGAPDLSVPQWVIHNF